MRIRKTLSTVFVTVLVVLGALCGCAKGESRQRDIDFEVFTDRARFERFLKGEVRVIDFDDIETEGSQPVAFESRRYVETTGAIIQGDSAGGQFVSRDFDFPNEFIPYSAPNVYAPGPISPETGPQRITWVRFVLGENRGQVAGFAAVFIDADYPNLGPSSLAVFDAAGHLLHTTGTVSGSNASQLFRGIIAVEPGTRRPIPVITEVQLITGNEWPSVDSGEGVVLDDFVFSQVRPVTGPNNSSSEGVGE